MIMPPKTVPKLDGQGQRRLSSFFNNDSDKIGRKIDNTNITDKCEETSTTLYFHTLKGLQLQV